MSIYGSVLFKEIYDMLGCSFDTIYHADAEVLGKPALSLTISSFDIEEEEGNLILTGYYGFGGQFTVDTPTERERAIHEARKEYLELVSKLKREWAQRIRADGYDFL